MVAIKKNVMLEHKDGDDSIVLICDENTQLGKIWDAINQFRVVIYQQIQQDAAISEEEEVSEEAQEEAQEA